MHTFRRGSSGSREPEPVMARHVLKDECPQMVLVGGLVVLGSRPIPPGRGWTQ